MELKFKSLQGSTFTVAAEPSDTIATVKGKVESSQGHAASSQKIIYSGKILTDNDTVQSCGVSEKDFLVLMVSKPKAAKTAPAPAPAPAAAAPAASEAAKDAPPAAAASGAASSEASTPAPATSAPVPAPSAAAPPAPSEQPSAETGPPGSSQFLTGSALEQAVNNMVEMGFPKSEVQRAMRASFNNPERAVEYLMTGIPEHLDRPQQAPQAGQAPPSGGEGAAPPASAPSTGAAPAAAPGGGGGGGGGGATASAAGGAQQGGDTPSNPRAGNLFEAAAAQAQGGGGGGGAAGRRPGGNGGDGMDALRSLGEDDGSGNTALDLGNPAMLAQLRQLVQQNPAALAPLVQALAQSNPQLANAMAEDPEGVLNLLASGAAGGLGGGEGDDESLPLPSMADLNPDDRSAVEQIVAMGIDENRAIEVYLMCGRNVEMAVQYYFENPQDFDD